MARLDPFADFRTDDHVALVTGGAQNIGEAIARIRLKPEWRRADVSRKRAPARPAGGGVREGFACRA